MSTEDSYSVVAQTYVDEVHIMFGRSPSDIAERGARTPMPEPNLIVHAQQLSQVSGKLTAVTASGLVSCEPVSRSENEIRLLAKALTDLDVGDYLLQVAIDEELGAVRTAGLGIERQGVVSGDLEYQLSLLLGSPLQSAVAVERSMRQPPDAFTAKNDLIDAIVDTLEVVTQRAGNSAKTALTGLAGLGFAQVGQAAGMVGLGLAQFVGQAEQATQLYSLVREFVVRAYESVWSLLGPELGAMVGKQISEWVEKIETGTDVMHWLETLYDSEQVSQTLVTAVNNSEASLDTYVAAIEQANWLQSGFIQRTSLVDKLLPKVKFLQLVPAAQLPTGILLLASFYIVAAGYVVLVGGDHLDVPRRPWLDRVHGVRHLIEENLGHV